jgi:hypothetical protein
MDAGRHIPRTDLLVLVLVVLAELVSLGHVGPHLSALVRPERNSPLTNTGTIWGWVVVVAPSAGTALGGS